MSMLLPVTLNFDNFTAKACYQGADFNFTFEWLDSTKTIKDLSSNHLIKMQIRKVRNSELVEELSLANGQIDIDSNLAINLSIPAVTTETFEAGSYLYDLKITNIITLNVTPLLKGQFVVMQEITT